MSALAHTNKDDEQFWAGHDPGELLRSYGSPLYVYNESILRKRCRELKNLVTYKKFIVDYSMKANSNPALLRIIRDEGIEVDVMSPGEIYIAQLAGYQPEEIFYIGNNVSSEEMQYAIDRGIKTSVDSLAQLEQYGTLAPGGEVAIRFNPGIGAGHHKKVVTAGKDTKFGINAECLGSIKTILEKYSLKLIGINQHIGSLFLNGEEYVKSVDQLMAFAKEFPDLEFVDLGGGFGVPYRAGEGRLDLVTLGETLDKLMNEFVRDYGREVVFRIEPGRYIPAECGVLLGAVHAVKFNGEKKYIGTDIGFNVLMRPVLYDAYHEIGFYRNGQLLDHDRTEAATVVGNICETGDILAEARLLPVVRQGDVIAVKTAGSYGHAMCSNYNARLRPAEILITEDGQVRAIRKRDSFENIVQNYIL